MLNAILWAGTICIIIIMLVATVFLSVWIAKEIMAWR
jgi:hypothetical protein